ncbi:myb/SANT-like DNA-binding domain-containing protein 4 [Eleginops maclovinus]|uniref:myb/SANT-like DNA-binding domain-containing protein 4 n=1 Tax=Eleginops maclovinus TaxID=56733 RepID=UPI003080D682
MARSPYFTEEECEMIMRSYEEYKPTLAAKSNTAAANKARLGCWQQITDRVNSGTSSAKRTWQQVKMKYKNIIQNANKKKVEIRRTGGGRAPDSFTLAEELALANNSGRVMMDGVAGVQSNPGAAEMSTLYVQVEGGNITTLQPPGCIHPLTQDDDDDDDDDDETLTAPSDTHMQEDLEELSPPEASLPGTSQSDKATVDNVRSLYKKVLELDRTKKRLEIRKLELEIEKLEHEKKVLSYHSINI